MLHDAVGSDNSNTKYVELVMKCLWRIVRNLNDWINTINISTILVDLHLFLKVGLVSLQKPIQVQPNETFVIIDSKSDDSFSSGTCHS